MLIQILSKIDYPTSIKVKGKQRVIPHWLLLC